MTNSSKNPEKNEEWDCLVLRVLGIGVQISQWPKVNLAQCFILLPT